jgi:hypothetical protein
VYSRRPYFKHYLHPEIYEPVFERFANPEISESIRAIANLTKIPLKTLYRWRGHYLNNASWRPNRRQMLPNRRKFTPGEEGAIAHYITERFLERHVPITLSVLRVIVLAKSEEFLADAGDIDGEAEHMRTPPRRQAFVCSRHFLSDFMKRNHLSYRCVRAARRPMIDQSEVERYRAEISEAYRTLPWDRILNADESFWLILYLPGKTVAEAGVETVKVHTEGDPKAGLTLLGTITAAGTKLPLLLVAKGLTSRCHKQLGIGLSRRWPVCIAHSPSGWVTQAVFNIYLEFLRQQIPDGPLCLVLDQYPTHVSVPSTALAARLGIQVITVPKGATGTWQPLDRRIYGIMKSSAHARWARQFLDDEIPVPTKARAAELALEVWDSLSQDVILGAWDFDESYTGDSDDDIPNDDDDAFLDVEYGHDDVDELDIAMMDELSTDDDDDNHT